ncbi:cyclin-like protein [Auricularia subglabra TFB-10046 SS5]|nr:cyclin-like protein [Auricularia subglabra TFB-10046 SS5]
MDVRTKRYQAYYTPAQVESLAATTRGKLTVAQEEKLRQQACTFIDAVGARMGFPRKTVATAQLLYHRFHLHFPRRDTPYYDVSAAALYVAAKIQDTLKKPRDILNAAYAVRFPELAAKIRGVAGEVDMDPNTVEADRQRLLAIERLLLEGLCFNFTLRLCFPYVIKLGRVLQASRDLTGLAWRIAVDSHRTLAPLIYPPHTMALACIRMAALLSSSASASPAPEPSSVPIAAMLSSPGSWEAQHRVALPDLEDICHTLVDLFLLYAPPSTSPANATPSSPPAPWTAPTAADKLTRLKVSMRETDHRPRPRRQVPPNPDDEQQQQPLGNNDNTVRFMFGP